MCSVIESIFENDISLAICVEESFADSVDRDRFSEFFERLKIVFNSRHRVSATRIIYPNIFAGGGSQNLDVADAVCAMLGRRIRLRTLWSLLTLLKLHVFFVLEFCVTGVSGVTCGAVKVTVLVGIVFRSLVVVV